MVVGRIRLSISRCIIRIRCRVGRCNLPTILIKVGLRRVGVCWIVGGWWVCIEWLGGWWWVSIGLRV